MLGMVSSYWCSIVTSSLRRTVFLIDIPLVGIPIP